MSFRSVVVRARVVIAGALAALLLAACAGGPPAEPEITQIGDGITKVRRLIPNADPTRIQYVEMYLPASPRPAPGVIVIPTAYMWTARAPETYDRNFAIDLAKLGFATMVPVIGQYPGGGGGYDARHAANMAAMSKWFKDMPEVMDDRIAAVGFSAGGFYAHLLATVDPSTRAVVAYYCPCDLEGPSPYQTIVAPQVANSPARNAALNKAPTLLFHGEDDNEIPVVQSRVYRDRLVAAGGTVELVTYPNSHHRFDRGPNSFMNGDTQQSTGIIYRLNTTSRDNAFDRTVAWLRRYMN